jgi:hypothetical protein
MQHARFAEQRDTHKTMSDTPETDNAQFGTGRVSVDFARRLEKERDEATERVTEAEILLADLAESYWRTILNDQDPSGEGLMGERVAQYWARYSHVMFKWVKYCEQSSTTNP